MNDILEIVKLIRASDCGGWLKDCGTAMFTCCNDGREKRQELSRLLDQLYKAAEAVDTNQTDRLDLLTQRVVLMEAQGSDVVEALGEAQETIHSLGNLVESSHKTLIARVSQLERQARARLSR